MIHTFFTITLLILVAYQVFDYIRFLDDYNRVLEENAELTRQAEELLKSITNEIR
jgi:hypothetical protein